MPQIDTPLLLDILLGLVILLFVPFGIRRGVAKEAMVSAGIFLGAALTERFGETAAQELAGRLGLEPGVATFTSSTLLILGTTFLLGYGGGAALGVTRPGVLSRLSGGVLAAFNGALLLSYLLSWIERDLRPTALLDSGIISEALLRQSSQLMLYGAGVLLAMTVVAWIVHALRARRQPHELNGEPSGLSPSRQRPVRVASNAEVGKFEPGPETSAPSGRFAASIDATAPVGAYVQGGSWAESEYQDRLANGHGRGTDVDTMGRFSAPARGAEGDQTVWTAWSASGSGDQTAMPQDSSKWPVPSAHGVTGDERCAVCRARVGARDVFCPECGATL